MQDYRWVAILLFVAGGLILTVGVLWGVSAMNEGTLNTSGFLLLLAPLLVIEGLFSAAGIFIYRRATAEAGEMVEVTRQKRLLSALESRGRLSLSEAAIEIDVPLETIRADLYDLVGKGLFSGYIDWDDRILYARQARELRAAGQCPNCGAALELAGKGVISCPYCGTDIFL